MVALPGARRWCATKLAEDACGVFGRLTVRLVLHSGPGAARKKNAAQMRGVLTSRDLTYLETDRLNIRSIFSLVASQHDWLA